MKKSFFLALSLVCALVSCQKSEGVLPDDNSSLSEMRSKGGGGGSGIPSINIPLSDVPQAVKDAIAVAYPGFTLKEAEKQFEDEGIQYKLTIVTRTAKKRLLYTANWVFIGEKN
jgi:hypothetical protein